MLLSLAYGATRNGPPLNSTPPGVVTWTLPVVAPTGTVVVISVAETTSNTVGVPLKLTPVAPARSVPKMVMAAPTAPKCGSVFGSGSI